MAAIRADFAGIDPDSLRPSLHRPHMIGIGVDAARSIEIEDAVPPPCPTCDSVPMNHWELDAIESARSHSLLPDEFEYTVPDPGMPGPPRHPKALYGFSKAPYGFNDFKGVMSRQRFAR
jgi:hypothetical protein